METKHAMSITTDKAAAVESGITIIPTKTSTATGLRLGFQHISR